MGKQSIIIGSKLILSRMKNKKFIYMYIYRYKIKQ